VVATDLITRYDRVLRIALPRLAAWLGGLLALVLLCWSLPVPGGLVAVAITVAIWVSRVIGDANREHAVRVGMAVGLSAVSVAVDGWWTLALLVPLLGWVLIEREIDWVLRARLLTRNLAGHRVPLLGRVPQPGFQFSCAGLVVLGLGVAGALPAAITMVLIAITLAWAVVVSGYQLIRVRRHLPEREVAAALTQLAPRYYLYYSGPPEGGYQLEMWLPHLARTGLVGAIVVREARFLAAAAALSELPVVYAASAEAFEYAVVEGLATVFYVNNEARVVDGVRFAQLRHVHLGHGDSDKPSSYAAIFGIFDQIFVAGQAGADRFRQHGVAIPAEKFVLVGRPQLTGALQRVEAGTLGEPSVVLYAPTWRGALSDMQLSSLDRGVEIVAALLEAGAVVVFRPHPFSYRDAASRVLVARIDAVLAAAGGEHRTSAMTRTESVFASMNRSSAMVADTSSLITDYLFTNKPFVITLPRGAQAALTDSPLARAAVILDADTRPAVAIATLLGEDTKATERSRAQAYYLGGWPLVEYGQVFVDAARAAIEPK
jgi:hypothetical protein